MAEFEAKCPHCGAELKMQDEWVGLEAECPNCKQHFTIAPPSESQSSAADAAEQKAAESRPSAEPPSSKLSEFKSFFGSPSPGGKQSEKSESKFLFTCPNCGRKIKALESWRGRVVECPHCQKAVMIEDRHEVSGNNSPRKASPPPPPPNTPPGFEPLSGHVRNEEVDDLPIPDPGMTSLPPITSSFITKSGVCVLAGLTLLLGVLTIVTWLTEKEGKELTIILLVCSCILVVFWFFLGVIALRDRLQQKEMASVLLPKRLLVKILFSDFDPREYPSAFLSSICDEVQRMDCEYLKKLSVLRRFGKDKSQLVSAPATLFAPAFGGVPRLAEFEVQVCEDDMIYRYNLEAVTKIYTFEDQLFIYTGIWDYHLGRMLFEKTEAFFFKDITDIQTQSNYEIDEKKHVVYKESESFTLTSSSGNSISLTLGFDEAIAASGATYTRRSDNEKIVHAIRKMVEEKKAAIHE